VSATRLRVLVFTAALLLAACSRISQENFSKIERGMSEQEVISLLGSPSESSSVDILGVSGTSSRWIGRDAEISVRFVGGKVALKSFDKPGAK
jgi:SmpA / OmlA family